jgi:hypothetical protein
MARAAVSLFAGTTDSPESIATMPSSRLHLHRLNGQPLLLPCMRPTNGTISPRSSVFLTCSSTVNRNSLP